MLLTCPNFREARSDILPLARTGNDFDGTHPAHIITFLRRVGLGFTQILRDGIANDVLEADDLDVGRITSPTLELDI